MSLKFYNTLTRKKEIFIPVEPGSVGIYVCGPTVYKPSHIGHAVGPVIFDSLKKYLIYKGFKVTMVVNITDVDDKLIDEAGRRNISVSELAAKVSAGYFEAMEKLGVNSVDIYPRATDHIPDILDLIKKMGEKDAAYVVDGDVYCDITKCEDYGCLSNRQIDEQLAGTRELAGVSKRNPGDFALWKKAGPDELGWDSPWGRGRPGWHIECSAMSIKYLGETFDIHGGGMDLIFPHHENEIAQSQAATGKPFVKYWLHNGLTRVKTKAGGGEWKAEKMSKSLGNIRPLNELLDEYPPAIIRFFLLSTHYRRPIDFSDDSLMATMKGAKNIYRTLDRINLLAEKDIYSTGCNLKQMETLVDGEEDRVFFETVAHAQLRYLECLDDDFNTAGGISVLYELSSMANKFMDKRQIEAKSNPNLRELIAECGRMITRLGQIIGLLTEPLEEKSGGDELAGQLMEVLLQLRAEARQEKNYALADSIREKLKALNITIEDGPDGAVWRRD